MINELLENPTHIHYAKIWAIGIIVQGFYQYVNVGDLKYKYFILYVCLSFITSLLYYKIFTN